MTLVVARATDEAGVMVSDTHRVRRNPNFPSTTVEEHKDTLDGVLKTVVLAERIAVSYSGAKRWADRALKGLDTAKREHAESGEIVEHFEAIHERSIDAGDDFEQSTSFLLLFGGPPVELWSIKRGQACKEAVSWIGSLVT